MENAATARAKTTAATRTKRNDGDDEYRRSLSSGSRSTGNDLATTYQLRGFRDVFRFELDEDDFEQLERTVIAQAKPKKTTLRTDDVEVPLENIPLEFLKAYVEPQDGDDYGDDKEYPEIDFGNKSLWL